MRILGIDYGDSRTGLAITDSLNITAQGLETINNRGSDKIILKRLDEILNQYEINIIVIGRPINMNGTESERTEITDKFIHKLKCKYNKIKIKFMWHGSHSLFVNYNEQKFLEEILQLQKRKIVTSIGFFKKSMKEFYSKKGYNSYWLMNDVNLDKNKIEKKDRC